MDVSGYKEKLESIIAQNTLGSYGITGSAETLLLQDSNDFTIDNRTINIPVSVKDIVVEGDNLSRTITFFVNRYFDGVDLAQKAVKINYINAQGLSGSTFATNVQLDTDSFTFDWTIESETAVKAGTIKISVECFEVDTDNSKIYIWQTKPQEIKVEPTIKVLNNAFPSDYTYQIAFAANNDNNTVYQQLIDAGEPISIANRSILIPKLTDVVVSQDTMSQVITFILPRYFDNVDLSTKVLSIKYINAEGAGDRSPISNMVVNDAELRIGWVLDSKVTAKNGTVQFALEAIGYDEKFNFYCWQTKPSTLQIEKGLNVDSIIVDPEPSWMQKWIIDVDNNLTQMLDLKNSAYQSMVVSENSAVSSASSAQLSQSYANQAQQIKDSTEMEYNVQSSRVGFKRKDETEYVYTGDLTGPKGEPLRISGTYATLLDLQNAVPSPIAGDVYNVGTSSPYEMYMWDGVLLQWLNQGAIAIKGDTGEKGQDGNPKTVTNTSSVNLTLLNDNLSADVVRSPDVGNALEVRENGLFVTPSSSEKPIGTQWEAFEIISNDGSTYEWYSVCFGAGRYVMLSRNGYTAISEDGKQWTVSDTSFDGEAWVDICYGDGKFVAISEDEQICVSSDRGETWQLVENPFANLWTAICYSEEKHLFVAVASSGLGNRVMTSPDAFNWTIGISAADKGWCDVCYGNGLFVAVASDDTTSNKIMISSDGFDWSISPLFSRVMWTSVCYGNGIFVIVSSSGEGTTTAISSDGKSWTLIPAAAQQVWNKVCFASGMFIAIGYTNYRIDSVVMTSSNPGEEGWHLQDSPNSNSGWTDICYGNGLAVAVAYMTSYPQVMISGNPTHASEIGFIPPSSMISSNVQDAIVELNGNILTKATPSDLTTAITTHNNDPTAHFEVMEKKANVSSPNLWGPRGFEFPNTITGVTLDYNPDAEIYTLNGTNSGASNATFRIAFEPYQWTSGQLYSLAYYYIDGDIVASGNAINTTARAQTSGGADLSPIWNVGGNHTGVNYTTNKAFANTVTAAAEQDGVMIRLQIAAFPGVTFNNLQFKLQLEKGSQTPWQPYRSLDTVTTRITNLESTIGTLNDVLEARLDGEG